MKSSASIRVITFTNDNRGEMYLLLRRLNRLND
ncbi:hypothetical protein ES703_02775 [subsurface metagenome]